MNTQNAHAKPACQVFLHPAAITNRAAILRMQQRHGIVFQVSGSRIVGRPANDLPGGGDAA